MENMRIMLSDCNLNRNYKRNKRSVQEEEIVSFNLEGLKAYTSYTVIVLAFTIKDGVPTLAKNFTTAEMGRFCWD